MPAILLLSAALLGQAVPPGSLEIKNQTGDQSVYVFVFDYQVGAWINKGKPYLFRPNMAMRLNLTPGRYRVHFRSDSNATLDMDRVLSSREVDRLRVGDPDASLASSQMKVFTVRGNYGDSAMATPPPMVTPPG